MKPNQPLPVHKNLSKTAQTQKWQPPQPDLETPPPSGQAYLVKASHNQTQALPVHKNLSKTAKTQKWQPSPLA
jgi:hypothetical protein